MNFAYVKYIFLAGFLILAACERESDRSADRTLATIGEHAITVTDFMTAYQAGSSLLKDVHHPRQSFLAAMINEALLANMLEQDSSYNQRPDILKAGRLLEQELLVERLFKTEVHDRVQVSEQEIQDAILRSRRSVRARYLVSQNREFAEDCLQQLDAGVAFDSLMNHVPDSLVQKVILDSTDYLQYGELDATVNDILFQLQPQEYSEVLPLGKAYVILQSMASLEEIHTPADFDRYHDRFHKILMYRKRLDAARQYVKKFMDPLAVEVDGQAFGLLVNALYDLYVNIPYEQSHLPDIGQNDSETPYARVLDQLQQHGQDPAVRFRDGVLTVENLLDQLLLKPFHIEAGNKQAFAGELNHEIAIALRDYFMAEEARVRGYDQDVEILKELDQWYQKLLVQDYIEAVRQHVSVDSATIRELAGNRTAITAARWKQAEQQVKNLRCQTELQHVSDSLAALSDIQINEQLLQSLAVDQPGPGHAPDVQLFKLGLPYLRTAFPTPDPIWGIR